MDLSACLAESAEAFSKEFTLPISGYQFRSLAKKSPLLAITAIYDELSTRETNFNCSKAGNNFCRIDDVIPHILDNSAKAEMDIICLHADLTLLRSLTLLVEDHTFLAMYIKPQSPRFGRLAAPKPIIRSGSSR